MAYQRGDVVYVPFQYTDLSSGKVRPTLVVSSAELHAADRLYIVAAITSNIAASPLGHLIGDLASAGLKVPSLVRPVLLTLDHSVMGRRVGRLAPTDLHQINVMLQRTLGLPSSRK